MTKILDNDQFKNNNSVLEPHYYKCQCYNPKTQFTIKCSIY